MHNRPHPALCLALIISCITVCKIPQIRFEGEKAYPGVLQVISICTWTCQVYVDLFNLYELLCISKNTLISYIFSCELNYSQDPFLIWVTGMSKATEEEDKALFGFPRKTKKTAPKFSLLSDLLSWLNSDIMGNRITCPEGQNQPFIQFSQQCNYLPQFFLLI